MFSKLFKKKSLPCPLDTASLPAGQRVYAIGDIHGRNDLLKNLLDKIEADDDARPTAETCIVFLGDLVDRGPDSAGVINTAITLQQSGKNVRFLMGNHEEVFIAAAKGSEKTVRFFHKIGGRETILSYDISLREFQSLSMEELAVRLPELVPAAHVEFLESFEDQIIIGDYAFVHAGIKPDVSLNEQKPKDLRWIREEFLSHDGPHEKIIIYGHTINEEVVEAGSRIGIDTGAYYTDVLTALCLENDDRWYLDTRDCVREH